MTKRIAILALCLSLIFTAAFAEAGYELPDGYTDYAEGEIYCWLEIPGLDVSSPVLQNPTDDEYYLTHDANGEEDNNGALFTQKTYNESVEDDTVTVIYGNNSDEECGLGNMEAYFTDASHMNGVDNVINVYTDESKTTFTVFAAIPYNSLHILHYNDFDNPREYDQFIENIYSIRALGALVDIANKPGVNEQLLVLSTSLKEDEEGRFLVLARKVGRTTAAGEVIDIEVEREERTQEALDEYSFTPSVSGKLAPTVVGVLDAEGNLISSSSSETEEGEEGEDEEKDVDDEGAIIVTSVAKRDEAPEEVKSILEMAYEEIKEVASIGELECVIEDEDTIEQEIDTLLDKLNMYASASDLVVRDMFSVTAMGTYEAYLMGENNYIDVQFDAGINVNIPVIVMLSTDGSTWKVLDEDMVYRTEEGLVVVRMYEPGVLAFMVKADYSQVEVDEENRVNSPGTGSNNVGSEE